MRVVSLVGNPNRGGRTTTVADAIARRIAALGRGDVETIELVDYASQLFDWSSGAVAELTARVHAAEAVVVASPTYKASMTGLLKAFLDRYGSNGLAGVVAVPDLLGGSPRHALAVETQLRPVLVELAATVPTKGLYLVESELGGLEGTLDEWWVLAEPVLRRSLNIGG